MTQHGRFSNQLYAKSTHFLLELIQNADDNIYNCDKPTLSFTYRPGTLRIDCNEVGFTPANVQAICSINSSTKSGKSTDGEHIGEKGIGFKSVFKAADVVWISSGSFSFKFDKRHSPLGMVTPTWADFPEPIMPGFTSIYLQLSETYDEQTMIQELLMFDSNLLIFLRRSEEINLEVIRPGQLVWQKHIWKSREKQRDNHVVNLHNGIDTVYRPVSDQNPSHPRPSTRTKATRLEREQNHPRFPNCIGKLQACIQSSKCLCLPSNQE